MPFAGHLAAVPEGVIVKIGTLDDSSVFEGPNMVFWAQEKQDFHLLPEVAGYRSRRSAGALSHSVNGADWEFDRIIAVGEMTN